MTDELIHAYDEYIELLFLELKEVIPIAHVHGWKSSRIEEGTRLFRKISELRLKYNATLKDIFVAPTLPTFNDPPFCPNCQKPHYPTTPCSS